MCIKLILDYLIGIYFLLSPSLLPTMILKPSNPIKHHKA